MLSALLRSAPAGWSLLAGLLLCSPAAAQTTARVSVDSAGVQGNSNSDLGSISADGRVVAVESFATNLVPGDTNGSYDIFVHDRQTGQTSRVSVSSAGVQGNSSSTDPALSADGRFVAFSSAATDLVPSDTNGVMDIFVHDRLTGQTRRVSLDSAGVEGNDESRDPVLSADGRTVAFTSSATNLVPGGGINPRHIYVHDRQTGQTSRVSVNSAGVPAGLCDDPSISADGSQVAFWSWADWLVPGDTNREADVFVHNRLTGQTSRVSVDSAGVEGNRNSSWGSISMDGRTVSFTSIATNLVPGDTNGAADVFVHDRQTGQTIRVSVSSAGVQGNGDSNWPAISADGSLIAFHSPATNLVPADTNDDDDVFVHELRTGQTSRVSVDSAGVQGNEDSRWVSISASGRILVFASGADNLVPYDMNQDSDVFVHDRGAPVPTLAQLGSCPGTITLTIRNATAGGKVAIACGPAGNFVRGKSPCDGLPLDVTPPALTAILTADLAGTAFLSLSAPVGFCGLSVQAVDAATCAATNVIVL